VALPWSCRRHPRATSKSNGCTTRVSAKTPPKAPLHPDALARFVEPLPVPATMAPRGTHVDPDDPSAELPFYRVAMRETEVRVHRDVPPTRVWSYGDAVPGPTFEAHAARPFLVEWRNELPERHFLPIDRSLCGAGEGRPDVRTIVHLHGGRVPPASDGYPDDWYTPGRSLLCRYPNRQEAATLWYHDHAMGVERLNQYAGLFGFYLLRDDVESALRLPSGPREVPIVLCDRFFHADGSLRYPTSGVAEAPWVSEVNGDAHLVNGKLFPYLEVEPAAYRFRVLNASNSRVYDLSASSGQPFWQIGTDQGLLERPVSVRRVRLAPAERADLLFDFRASAGQEVALRHQVFPLLQFRVRRGPAAPPWQPPSRLREVHAIAPGAAAQTRTLTLNEYEDPRTHVMLMLLDGKRWSEPVTERPALGSVEVWDLVNLTEDSHPVHLHLVRFQVVSRQKFDADGYLTTGVMRRIGDPVPPAPEEAGWKDTVRAEPGLVTRIAIRFEGYAGRYVWHCHVLEHAANEMMRPFEVTGV